jgi:hemolysin activation/secretion protein
LWRLLAPTAALAGLFGTPWVALAQTVPLQIVPQGSPIPRIEPTAPPIVRPPVQTPTPPAAAVGGPVLASVTSVVVEGSTVYQPATLAALAGSLHGQVTRAQIDTARQAILYRYRTDGYLFTAVNWSLDRQGVLRFQVVEGHIADVKLNGPVAPYGTQVLRFLRPLTDPSQTPIRAPALERALLLAQSVPGVTVRAVLRPSADVPGALTLEAVVERKAWDALFTADNRASTYTGPEEALLAIDANSFTEYGEKTTISLFRTFNDTQIFGQAAIEAFLGGSGLKLRVYGGSGTTDPSGALRADNYHGVTTNVGGTLSYPVILERSQALTVSGTFEMIDSRINIGTPPSEASRDNLRVARAGAEYELRDLWLGDAFGGLNRVNVVISQGVPILGSSPTSPLSSRQNAEVQDFTKITLDLSRVQTLFEPWPDATVRLKGSLSGQASPDILPSTEEYFLGGSQILRGYYAGEITGDNALLASAELQLATGFNADFIPRLGHVDTEYYLFYDWGETWQNQKSDYNHKLSSFGVGVRIDVSPNLRIELEGDHRDVVNPLGAEADVSKLSAYAFYWRALARF